MTTTRYTVSADVACANCRVRSRTQSTTSSPLRMTIDPSALDYSAVRSSPKVRRKTFEVTQVNTCGESVEGLAHPAPIDLCLQSAVAPRGVGTPTTKPHYDPVAGPKLRIVRRAAWSGRPRLHMFPARQQSSALILVSHGPSPGHAGHADYTRSRVCPPAFLTRGQRPGSFARRRLTTSGRMSAVLRRVAPTLVAVAPKTPA
jgi:hypothetical protein